MIKTISDKILEKLNTLKGSNKPFVDVFDYHTLQCNWYPYITFELREIEASILDNCENLRDLAFNIFIFQDINQEETNRKTAKNNLYNCIDSIFTVFDPNYTLDGLALGGVVPIYWNIEPFNTQNGKILVAQLNIICKKVY